MKTFVKPFKVDLHGNRVEKGDKLICPVCSKEFLVDENTCYICKGGYVCSWKCFSTNNREVEAKKQAEK